MAKPTPGQSYTVQVGDTMPSIASAAYGDPSKQELIRAINISNIKFTDIEDLAPGQILLIPVDEQLNSIRQAQLKRGLA